MSTTLDVWVNSGSLQRHTTSPQEVGDLLSVVQRDLAASQTAGLSDDRKLTIAYNAALQAAKVALAATCASPASSAGQACRSPRACSHPA